ncbi:uncharacterized protein [Aristolochia californica]|uniref:uncharacterized protein n=1 Tax=Aristolochia californica TaxID=171875 RepID=UPI0035D6A66C
MAAGQQKKRLSASSLVSCNLQEQYRSKKKKKHESSPNVLNMRSHISLEWDDSQNRAVAKREQIGITMRHMAPYMDSIPLSHVGLADIICIPQEIFGLENLSGVLSCQVWDAYLSQSERKFLSQFLPRGSDIDQVLQALFQGDNLHFGNPFLEWGASLCSGNLHPDAILHSERKFKSNRRVYYSELQKYHTDMLECLQMWRERWMCCEDPEKEIVEELWSPSRKNTDKNFSSQVVGSRSCEAEDSVIATADSGSQVAEEKIFTHKKATIFGKKMVKPVVRMEVSKHKTGTFLVTSERAKVLTDAKNVEKSQKVYIRSNDVAKYMSYFKISKKQHQQVKKLKQNGDGIQSKSLNHVLGDIERFHVQPYELFEEEQKKKLQEHWLKLAMRDVPAAFSHHKERQLQRQLWKRSIGQELETEVSLIDEVEVRENFNSSHHGQAVSGESEDAPSDDQSDDEEDEPVSPATYNNPPLPLQRVPSLDSYHDLPHSLDSKEASEEIVKQQAATPSLLQFSENTDHTEHVMELEASIASAKSIWKTVSVSDPYYHSTSRNHGFTSAGELTLSQPQPMKEQTSCVIDLEVTMVDPESEESLLPSSCNEVGGNALNIENGASLFCTYPSQDRNEPFPPFLKGQGMLQSYSNDHISGLKQQVLQFLPTNNGSPENDQFPGQFQEQQQRTFEQRHIREKDVFIHQLMEKNVYSNSRYPNQELFPSVDMQDWMTDSSCVGSLQGHINGSMLGPQNWFSGESRIRNGWSGVDVPASTGQCLGGAASSTDESLYGVLSQYNQLQLRPPYNSASAEHFNPSRSYGGGGFSGNADVFPYSAHQLNYLSGCEATAVKANNTSWTNLQHTSTSLHDQIGRPFLRSWNQ